MRTDDLWLPAIISDNMVVQTGKRVAIWGKAHPGETVRVELAGRSAGTTVRADGFFLVRLPALPPGGPYSLRIRAHAERFIANVLVGEVWLGSGQSNMSWPVSRSNDAGREIAAAAWPQIRIFTVAARASRNPCQDVDGRWEECSPDSVGSFSALLYFFGREIHRSLKMPVGLIDSSWGGTSIEPWIRVERLRQYEPSRQMLRQFEAELVRPPAGIEDGFREDRYNHGVARGWTGDACPDKGWRRITLPGYWTEKVKNVGAFWFRKTVRIPGSWAGQCLSLDLGPIVDFDTAYFKGQRIGGIGPETKGAWELPRQYVIPSEIVRPGRSVIAVRAFAHNNNGGFSGAECELAPMGQLGCGTVPGTVFNAMIHPLRHYTIRGFLWYQGESNVDQPARYRRLLPMLINDWRSQWRDDSLSFYVVQLPDYSSALGDQNLPLLREAQVAALALPHTGMAVTIDGHENDVHPRNKQMPGRRLALQALAGTYGRRVEYAGPTFLGLKVEGRLVRISFAHAGGLRLSGGRTLLGFLLAGDDRRFLPAQARIAGKQVVVWHRRITHPLAVRYAWAASPRVNLVNGSALPAAPFRTDNWNEPVTKE